MGVKKKTEFTEKLIQGALRCSFLSESTKKYEMYNMFIYDWESDYLALTKSGYAYECEIKISRSDFFNDKKKWHKHLILEGTLENNPEPNYFYYAVPEGLVTVDEVPEYAGLIYVYDCIRTKVIKPAPKLNPEKQDIDKLRLIDKFYYRLEGREEKLRRNNVSEMKNTINQLEKQCAWYDEKLSEQECEICELKMELNKLKDRK